ncbi:anther-specific proline-rich protein APG-like [Chiroxiphia lanceolata]|uniref:anther-specific proline-rich protein APG-like n=1 Tax=Chiroxiphia lanceolata TaxID=296741 RepID=UPI0013CEA86F|nr:anther-specific proline-rich protein APG-like [Chiroxiphia lanceolata]
MQLHHPTLSPRRKTTALAGYTQKPPVPRPPQPEAMPPLPTPSPDPAALRLPCAGQRDLRSFPACSGRSEIEPGRSLRPGEAQNHGTVSVVRHLWRSARPSARPSASFPGKAGRALPPHCSLHPAAEPAHSPHGPGSPQRPPAPSAPAHGG